MTQRNAGSIRARVRAELIDEIKTVARRHLAADGANLSLRAVARDMGMVSSALYRYFASRDDLLTALIIDGYNAMGEVAEAADAGVTERTDVLGRWLAVAHALRSWALAQPHEYALLYGSPVPGYAAPVDTVGPAGRPTVVLGSILGDAARQKKHGGGSKKKQADPPLSPGLRAEVHRIVSMVAPGAGLDDETLARGLIAWTELFGAISFELFGRLNNTIDHREEWFDHQMRVMAAFIGLGS